MIANLAAAPLLAYQKPGAIARANQPGRIVILPKPRPNRHNSKPQKHPHHLQTPYPSKLLISKPGAKKLEKIRPVAVLCVSGRSLYKHTAGVTAYDRLRDAKTFSGGLPVVAHPPCRCWSKALGHMARPKDRAGEMALGLWCVEQVKNCGGVLEHPAQSRLWAAANLPVPGDYSDPFCYTVYIEQGWFGLPCRKPTWILVCGVPRHSLPVVPMRLQDRRFGFKMMNQQERARTMPALVDWLVSTARATWHGLGMPICSSDLARANRHVPICPDYGAQIGTGQNRSSIGMCQSASCELGIGAKAIAGLSVFPSDASLSKSHNSDS